MKFADRVANSFVGDLLKSALKFDERSKSPEYKSRKLFDGDSTVSGDRTSPTTKSKAELDDRSKGNPSVESKFPKAAKPETDSVMDFGDCMKKKKKASTNKESSSVDFVYALNLAMIMKKKNKTDEEIKKVLISSGMTETEAQGTIEQVNAETVRQEDKKASVEKKSDKKEAEDKDILWEVLMRTKDPDINYKKTFIEIANQHDWKASHVQYVEDNNMDGRLEGPKSKDEIKEAFSGSIIKIIWVRDLGKILEEERLQDTTGSSKKEAGAKLKASDIPSTMWIDPYTKVIVLPSEISHPKLVKDPEKEYNEDEDVVVNLQTAVDAIVEDFDPEFGMIVEIDKELWMVDPAMVLVNEDDLVSKEAPMPKKTEKVEASEQLNIVVEAKESKKDSKESPIETTSISSPSEGEPMVLEIMKEEEASGATGRVVETVKEKKEKKEKKASVKVEADEPKTEEEELNMESTYKFRGTLVTNGKYQEREIEAMMIELIEGSDAPYMSVEDLKVFNYTRVSSKEDKVEKKASPKKSKGGILIISVPQDFMFPAFEDFLNASGFEATGVGGGSTEFEGNGTLENVRRLIEDQYGNNIAYSVDIIDIDGTKNRDIGVVESSKKASVEKKALNYKEIAELHQETVIDNLMSFDAEMIEKEDIVDEVTAVMEEFYAGWQDNDSKRLLDEVWPLYLTRTKNAGKPKVEGPAPKPTVKPVIPVATPEPKPEATPPAPKPAAPEVK